MGITPFEIGNATVQWQKRKLVNAGGGAGEANINPFCSSFAVWPHPCNPPTRPFAPTRLHVGVLQTNAFRSTYNRRLRPFMLKISDGFAWVQR
ncbi:unnamed protein product, partial [Iphiclides podalirius]